jgi:hypothetical protein
VRRLVALAVVAATLLGAATTAGAQQDGQDGQPASGVRLALRDRTAWVGDGVDFALSVQLDGAPTDARIRIVVHRRVTSRSAFAASVVGEGLRSVVYEAEDALADFAQSGGAISVVVPMVAQPALGIESAGIEEPGVYPVALEVRSSDGDVLATLRTHLVRLPTLDPGTDDVALRAVVVLPIDAPPAHLTVGPPTVPDAPLTEIAQVLAQHPTVPLTLAPTPETIAAAAAADPAATTALASTLAGRQVVGAPWVALDEGAWADTDPDELQRQLDRGRQALGTALGASVGSTRVLPAGASAAEVRAIAAQGTDLLVVADSDLVPLEDDLRFTLTRPFTLASDLVTAPLPTLAADTALTALAAGAETDPVLAAHLVLADLAVLASDQPTQARVATLVLPPVAARSQAFLAALLGGLEGPAAPTAPVPSLDPAVPTPEAIPAAAAVVQGSTVADAFATIEPAGTDGDPDPDDPLVRAMADGATPASIAGTARQLAAARSYVGAYTSTFGPDDPIDEQLDVLVATAASADLDGGARADALAAARAIIDEQLAALHPPDRQQVRLTAREGRIQLVLINDTGRPAQVTLLLRGDRLVLPDAPDGRLTVVLTEQSTRIDLRVEARSSGDAPLDVVLVTPDEQVELGRARITVRATAFSGVGVVLLAASALFLVVWWTRTIVRERRTARRRHPAHERGQRHPPASPPAS